jgi:hypothetical protein
MTPQYLVVDFFRLIIFQINMNLITNEYPNYQSFSSNYISIATQLEYKYIITIDGNTTTWDRIPWVFNSN